MSSKTVMLNRAGVPGSQRQGRKRKDAGYFGDCELSQQAWRTCLGYCGQVFLPSWPGHRICHDCAGKQGHTMTERVRLASVAKECPVQLDKLIRDA